MAYWSCILGCGTHSGTITLTSSPGPEARISRPGFVYGLRNKARTLPSKKEKNKMKERRRASLIIAKSTRRVAQWLIRPPKVGVRSPEGKNQVGDEKEQSRIAELFHHAKIDRRKLQTLRMLSTKAKGRWKRTKGDSPSGLVIWT
uniref:Uncharacterized protein n=1 Tax=Solanum tuberosum TaxID=4113 RepID=M1DHJ1_SOLTU